MRSRMDRRRAITPGTAAKKRGQTARRPDADSCGKGGQDSASPRSEQSGCTRSESEFSQQSYMARGATRDHEDVQRVDPSMREFPASLRDARAEVGGDPRTASSPGLGLVLGYCPSAPTGRKRCSGDRYFQGRFPLGMTERKAKAKAPRWTEEPGCTSPDRMNQRAAFGWPNVFLELQVARFWSSGFVFVVSGGSWW
jgi:hypothetical protein